MSSEYDNWSAVAHGQVVQLYNMENGVWVLYEEIDITDLPAGLQDRPFDVQMFVYGWLKGKHYAMGYE
jgi:hypothetical protein